MTNYETQAINAIKKNDLIALKSLLDNKQVAVDFYTDIGWSSLLMAIEFDRKEIICFLLDLGANAGIKDMKEYSVLETTLILGYMDISKFLIEHGVKYQNINWNAIPDKLSQEIKEYIKVFEEKNNLENSLNAHSMVKKNNKL
jgi:ankyrin repeat protein